MIAKYDLKDAISDGVLSPSIIILSNIRLIVMSLRKLDI